MSILNIGQYNQSIGKSKLLSNAAGVGSIVTTKDGYYIMVSDINKWRFIKSAQREISEVRNDFSEREWYVKSIKKIEGLGLSAVNDPRFISFLKQNIELPNLLCLLSIPHLSINEHFNTVNVKSNPKIQRLRESGINSIAEDFMVPASHFPKWFRNGRGELKMYSEWKKIWEKSGHGIHNFAPPRDAKRPIKKNGKQIILKTKNDSGEQSIPLFEQLTQSNLVLICPNGHISDIPWSKFINWKNSRSGNQDKGENLFYVEDCCAQPSLKWSESTTKSEGYSSIYIECKNCEKKHNLEGINNISPFCLGEKPWEINVENSKSSIPRNDSCLNVHGARQTMQQALVTGNSVYYSSGFSSLYIPRELTEGENIEVLEIMEQFEDRYKIFLQLEPNGTKAEFSKRYMTSQNLFSEYEEQVNRIDGFEEKLKQLFLGQDEKNTEDTYEDYRWQEYQCFLNFEKTPESVAGIQFNDIKIPDSLNQYFSKIQQVEELKVSNVQLEFTRVKPNERIIVDGVVQNRTNGQQIYSEDEGEVFVIPANESFGEGIFIGFNEDTLKLWHEEFKAEHKSRYQEILNPNTDSIQGQGSRERIKADGMYQGSKFYLIHTFSHLLMRELEFSCGYPTASLSERLYISDRMSGVLIYTTEGSEGSMGGLVWQGLPEKIENLIKSMIERGLDCSSDPLCWESDGQGIFNMNLASCFACSLVSETACEEWNLGLDRRIIIDPNYGYFRNL